MNSSRTARDSKNIVYISDPHTEIVIDLLSGPAIVLYLALFKLLLHFYFNAFSYYGFLRDELYFIDCTKHLDWGYVDIGPLTIWMGWLERMALGDSIFALRVWPALAGAAAIIVAGAIARELGGKRFAQGLAALAVLVCPFWLGAQNNLCLPASEPLWWGLCAWIVIRLIKTENPKYWLWFGIVAGIGLLNKPSMAFLGGATVIALLFTPQRRLLFNRWLIFGGLIAFAIALPYILWQIPRHWPTLQFLIGMNRGLMARISAPAFVLGQVFYLHPFLVPVWLAGLFYFLRAADARPYRALGWTYVIIFLFLLIVKSKIYYILPVYVMLIGAGAVAIEGFMQRRAPRLIIAAPILLILGGLVTAPVALPIFSIQTADTYIRHTIGAIVPAHEVMQTFHDECGWENQAKVIAGVYQKLSPEEKADCMIFAGNFGEAGAIDFYGPALGLPNAYSSHQNYYFWGPPKESGELVIVFGVKPDILRQFFTEIQQVATITCEQAVEKDVPVYICRKPTTTLKDAWPMIRAFAFING